MRATLPELPEQKRQRYIDELGLSEYNAELLSASREIADYFETALAQAEELSHQLANWILGDVTGALNKSDLDFSDCPVAPAQLAGLLRRIADDTISGKIAKTVFEAMWNGEGDADAIIEARGLKQITDSGAIEAIVDEVLAENSQQVENYRNADPKKQPKMLGFFVGQVMKKSQGKANPKQVNELLRKKLAD
jgi:aspartyl-tRNA(Asn)/glutamyl-tRNA(Gln) amidotransferase subunit B